MSRPDAAGRIVASLGRSTAARWFRAPGRVNLIGEHTDYNAGLALPMAIDRDCVIAATPSGTVRVRSLDTDGSVEVPADGSAAVDDVAPGWGRQVAAVVQELAALGRPAVGMDAVLASDVLVGSGLSSSAAFEVACAVALAGVAGWEPGPIELAAACRDAEELATGVPCGLMDQLISVAGREGHAQLVDFRSLELRAVPLPAQLAVLVVHSGQERALADSAYADRRRACEALARAFGVPSLREATAEQVADEPLARHVVTENVRVLEAVEALQGGDLVRFGALLDASHASLRDDYRVSTPELDCLVEALVDAGALGARLTGAGFGGSVMAACESPAVERTAEAATERYRRATGLAAHAFLCRSVDGAGPRPAPSG